MEQIKELSHLIELQKPSAFGQLIPKDSKLRTLYDLVVEKESTTNAEAAKIIYGSKANDKRFLMLKRNLTNKLSELVLLTDHSELNKKNFIKTKFWCEKNLTIANKLLYVNVYHNAEKMTLKSLSKAQEYHLTEIELNCYIALRKINYLKGFPDQVEKFQEKVYQTLQVKSQMEISWGMMEFLLGSIKFSRAQSPKISDKAFHYSKEIEIYYAKTKNPFFKILWYRIKLIEYHQKRDYESNLSVLKELQSYLVDFPYLETEHLALEKRLSETRQLVGVRKWKEALRTIKKTLKLTTYTAFNKFEVQAEHFEIQVKLENYAKAKSILIEVYETQQFEQLDKADKSSWAIRAAYLYFWGLSQGEETTLKGFSMEQSKEFFSLCLAISKDKAGFNLQFIIVRILITWFKGGMDFESESNNLKVYHQRYLRNSPCVRSRFFFKALEKLTRASFSDSKYHSLHDQFAKDLPGSSVDFNEIIPYEKLWLMMGSLKSMNK